MLKQSTHVEYDYTGVTAACALEIHGLSIRATSAPIIVSTLVGGFDQAQVAS
jgi:hypothetical protein